MSSIRELKQALDEARKRRDRAIRDVTAGKLGSRSGEYWAVRREVLDLERQVASAKGEPHAVPCDFPVQWDTGAPLPHLFTNDYRAFLTFYVRQVDPNWDGTYCTVKDPSNGSLESLALVEFEGCCAAKLGSPNEEVFHGHYLHERGLDPCTAQIVKNSPWIEELRAVNAVHKLFDPNEWETLNHYVLWFHDSTFECVAESFRVELHETSMRELATMVVSKLLK